MPRVTISRRRKVRGRVSSCGLNGRSKRRCRRGPTEEPSDVFRYLGAGGSLHQRRSPEVERGFVCDLIDQVCAEVKAARQGKSILGLVLTDC